ncbi:MAG: urease accessory protein UreD [Phormidesmis sp.]
MLSNLGLSDVVSPTSIEQLTLKLDCNAVGKTVLTRRYMAYPLSVSPIFRLEENGSAASANRAYLYRMNTSPGLLAGDTLKISMQLEAGAQLYLADQSATKIHSMPEDNAQAVVNYRIEVGDRATLEFLPEPLILFADSALQQTTEITLHPSAALSLGEIVLPGRLARGERYQFRQYFSRLRLRSPGGQVWFTESMKLLGKDNRFVEQALFSSGAVLGTLVLVLPEAIATGENLSALSAEIDQLAGDESSLVLASSVLPSEKGIGERGLFVRAMAKTTREMQACFKAAVNCVRKLRGEAAMPYSL